MNAHCDFHPFESAVDVCNRCYADMCRGCVVQLPGRSHPVCKECAIDLSGVRRSPRSVQRGDKRTVKARRESYQDPNKGKRDKPAGERDGSGDRRTGDERRRGERRDADSGLRGALRFLSFRRRRTDSAGDELSDSAEPEGGSSGSDGSYSSQRRPAAAVDRLDRLRRSLHPTDRADGDDSPVTDDAEAVAEAPVHDSTPEPPQLDLAGAMAAMPGPDRDSGAHTSALRSLASDVAAMRPTAAAPHQSPPTTVSDLGNHFDAPDPWYNPADLTVDPFADLDQIPEQDQGQIPERDGDTDEQGRWIPPTLRGFAPGAAEAGHELPRRR